MLIEAVKGWLPNELKLSAENVVALHLDPNNFPMSIKVDCPKKMEEALRDGVPYKELRKFVSFEDTQTSAGICRVMVRTHLNRGGINFVSRGFSKKTLAERVMGVFPIDLDPNSLATWETLTSSWLTFAEKARNNKMLDEKGEDLFSDKDILSLRLLSKIKPADYMPTKNTHPDIHNNWGRLVKGVHSGLNYLNSNYEFNPTKIWHHIDLASKSAQGVHDLTKDASRSIHEYGTTLAGSFFADLGAKRFVKDDVHVVDSIAAFLGKERSQVKGEFAYNLIAHTADKHGVDPRAVDKVMYLACSGSLYLLGYKPSKSAAANGKVDFLNFLAIFSNK